MLVLVCLLVCRAVLPLQTHRHGAPHPLSYPFFCALPTPHRHPVICICVCVRFLVALSQAGNDHSANGAPEGGVDVDPLGVHVESFKEGEEDSRDDVQEVSCPWLTREEGGLRGWGWEA